MALANVEQRGLGERNRVVPAGAGNNKAASYSGSYAQDTGPGRVRGPVGVCCRCWLPAGERFLGHVAEGADDRHGPRGSGVERIGPRGRTSERAPSRGSPARRN
jgi:hypothetical protein